MPENYKYSNGKAWSWHEFKQTDQCIRREDPHVNPESCSHLNFNKEYISTHWRKDCILQWILVLKNMLNDKKQSIKF